MDANPDIIQPEDWINPNTPGRSIPVFLIHDGGGTTFAYHCLEPLLRTAYGIHNPHYHSGAIFEGGIPEMGKLYSGFIKKTISEPDFPSKRNSDGSVNILLGGWSLGGLLSLEVARQLAEDCSVRIIGILMMDSICPIAPPTGTRVASSRESEEGKSKNQILSDRAMAEARRMIRSWDLPVWDGHLTGQRPRISMLRAKERVPTKGDEGVKLVDVYRMDKHLGWDGYEENLFVEVVPVEGHHFNMFSFDRIPAITEAIKKSLDKLESLASTSSR
ncbi:Alpha/Beta hydrolase protein [Dactylonectria estremocensis]|uniref:Alpha/Beta hydrolase protein n=1 Tax=Dactylonectria estremocensis TaxID=1079267 RepID=A0A9P9EQI3_9HYPO|nr:Alpha/Beta hydrolase protein [Dactylonectria estremocensis]